MSNVWHTGLETTTIAAGYEMDAISGAVGTNLFSVSSPVHGDFWSQRAVRCVRSGAAGLAYMQHQFGATGNSGVNWFYGVAVQWNTLPDAECKFIEIHQAIVPYLSVRLTTGGVVRLYRDDTNAQLGGDGPTIQTGRYYWYAISYIPGSGQASLYVEGLGLVARGTAATNQSNVRLRVGLITSVIGELHFDDIVVNNSSGTRNNTLPPETYIFAIRPNADGDNNQSSGSWADIDELTPDEATTLAILDVDNDIIDVNVEGTLAALAGPRPANMPIAFVGVHIRERTSGIADAQFNLRIKSQAVGTLGTSGTYTHNDTTFRTNGDTPPLIPYVSELDPQNSRPWIYSRLESAQIGVQATDASPDVEITQLWLYVAVQPWPRRLASQGAG